VSPMYRIICIIIVVLFFSGCAGQDKVQTSYPRKPGDSSGRKAGAAMLLYEQAEEDLDVNTNVTVTPPAQIKTEE